MARLVINRTVPAPPERVWRAFTDATVLTAWFWPHLDNAAELDPRPGGRYLISGPKAGIAVSGAYQQVSPPERLAFSWRWDGEEAETLVTVELANQDGHTELTVVHHGFPDDTTRDDHIQGWQDCLDRLPGTLAD